VGWWSPYIAYEESDLTLNDVRVNTGHYALLKLVNDALDYEIHRLDQAGTI
jgi:hypothetical protein